MIEVFKRYVQANSTITDEEWAQIASVCQLKKLRKRQYLLQEGDVCKYNAFVTRGCLRTYSTDEKGNEHILSFAIENWWAADRESLTSGQPSIYNIEALEDSEVILISVANFDHLCNSLPAFNNMVNSILQKSFVAAQGRIHNAISLGAEEKYQRFMDKYPQLAQRVPQGMIASYLGITPETLSRIRRQSLKRE